MKALNAVFNTKYPDMYPKIRKCNIYPAQPHVTHGGVVLGHRVCIVAIATGKIFWANFNCKLYDMNFERPNMSIAYAQKVSSEQPFPVSGGGSISGAAFRRCPPEKVLTPGAPEKVLTPGVPEKVLAPSHMQPCR
jgi:hypothetical protein